jgi:hypothetical protein
MYYKHTLWVAHVIFLWSGANHTQRDRSQKQSSASANTVHRIQDILATLPEVFRGFSISLRKIAWIVR